MGGVIALSLTACTTDSVFEDMDQQTSTDANNGPQNQTNSFNDNNPGHTHGDIPQSGLIWRGTDYYSPWDIWFRTNTYGDKDLQPNYIFSTIHSGEKEGIQNNYKLEVFAYVGLAYFDGINNGTYADVATSGPTLQYNLASGNYPNLYAGNKEVGNLIKTAAPFIVQPNQGYRVEDKAKHLLTNVPGAIDKYPSLNPSGQRFVFSGITTQEEELLATYGKVFFYEVFVSDATTGANIAHEFMQLNPQAYPSGSLPASLKNPSWQPVNDLIGNQINGNAPAGFGSVPLSYLNTNLTTGTDWVPVSIPPHPTCTYTSDSREVIFDLPVNMHRVPLIGTDNLVLDVLGSSRYGWLNSSIYLHIE